MAKHRIGAGVWFLLAVLWSITTASAEEPRFDIWYGDHQRFGHLGGHPQRWINVLGHVAAAGEIQTLTYRLNGGRPQPLSFAEDKKRLARDGDFNVEILRSDLRDGDNRVVLEAVDRSGAVARHEVRVDYDAGADAWPLPYTIDWSTVKRIEDVTQVTDGKWELTADGIRSVQRYYDRAFAFGDATWTDYEVSTSITVHALTPPKTDPNTTRVTHAAIALRWPGHDADGNQPTVKWHPLGATAEFRLGGELQECRWRIFDGQKRFSVESDRRRSLQLETRYDVKHRVETLSDGTSRYQAKLWPAGEPEPERWDLVRIEAEEDVPRGSVLLLAHHSEVTFGNVTVVPLGAE